MALLDIAFFSPAEDCCEPIAIDGDETSLEENSCCSDEIIVIEGQDDLKLSFNDLDIGQQIFLVAFTNSYIDLFNGLKEQVVPHKKYPPPLLVKNIQVLDQVFII